MAITIAKPYRHVGNITIRYQTRVCTINGGKHLVHAYCTVTEAISITLDVLEMRRGKQRNREGLVCTLYCVLCTVYCVILCVVYCTVYYVLYSVQCVLCSVVCATCTLYCLPLSVYSVLCSLYGTSASMTMVRVGPI